MKTLLNLALALVLAAPVLARAENHPLSAIRGTNIDLKTYDHAVAGSVKDFVIFGNNDEENFTSELVMKRDGQVVRAVFAKNENGKIGGVISHQTEKGLRETKIEFVKVLGAERKILLKVNGTDVVVSIKADAFENNHFINPEYSTEYNGEKVSFKMENGQACYGFSLHLVFMIFGAYFH